MNYLAKHLKEKIKDTVHRPVAAGSQKWVWECWDNRDRGVHLTTSPPDHQGRNEWTRGGKPRAECELSTETWQQELVRSKKDIHSAVEGAGLKIKEPAASLAVLALRFSADRFCWLSALCCLNCWISFRERERPVPSYLQRQTENVPTQCRPSVRQHFRQGSYSIRPVKLKTF